MKRLLLFSIILFLISCSGERKIDVAELVQIEFYKQEVIERFMIDSISYNTDSPTNYGTIFMKEMIIKGVVNIDKIYTSSRSKFNRYIINKTIKFDPNKKGADRFIDEKYKEIINNIEYPKLSNEKYLGSLDNYETYKYDIINYKGHVIVRIKEGVYEIQELKYGSDFDSWNNFYKSIERL